MLYVCRLPLLFYYFIILVSVFERESQTLCCFPLHVVLSLFWTILLVLGGNKRRMWKVLGMYIWELMKLLSTEDVSVGVFS